MQGAGADLDEPQIGLIADWAIDTGTAEQESAGCHRGQIGSRQDIARAGIHRVHKHRECRGGCAAAHDGIVLAASGDGDDRAVAGGRKWAGHGEVGRPVRVAKLKDGDIGAVAQSKHGRRRQVVVTATSKNGPAVLERGRSRIGARAGQRECVRRVGGIEEQIKGGARVVLNRPRDDGVARAVDEPVSRGGEVHVPEGKEFVGQQSVLADVVRGVHASARGVGAGKCEAVIANEGKGATGDGIGDGAIRTIGEEDAAGQRQRPAAKGAGRQRCAAAACAQHADIDGRRTRVSALTAEHPSRTAVHGDSERPAIVGKVAGDLVCLGI